MYYSINYYMQLIFRVQGRRHDFEIGGGAESEVGRKMCARLRARIFWTTPTST